MIFGVSVGVLVLLVLVVLLGATMQGLVGLGLNLVSAPVVTMVEPSLMPEVLLVLAVLLPFFTLMRSHEDIDWRGLGWVLSFRLPGTVLAWPRQPVARCLPERRDCAGLADHHPRATFGRRCREGSAARPGRHEVRPDVAQVGELPVRVLDGDEPPEAAPCDVLEEDALERLERTEIEHLLLRRNDEGHDSVFL